MTQLTQNKAQPINNNGLPWEAVIVEAKPQAKRTETANLNIHRYRA